MRASEREQSTSMRQSFPEASLGRPLESHVAPLGVPEIPWRFSGIPLGGPVPCVCSAVRLPCVCRAFAMRLPCVCHAFGMRLRWVCHAFAMRLLCVCHACAMLCHAFAMRLGKQGCSWKVLGNTRVSLGVLGGRGAPFGVPGESLVESLGSLVGVLGGLGGVLGVPSGCCWASWNPLGSTCSPIGKETRENTCQNEQPRSRFEDEAPEHVKTRGSDGRRCWTHVKTRVK